MSPYLAKSFNIIIFLSFYCSTKLSYEPLFTKEINPPIKIPVKIPEFTLIKVSIINKDKGKINKIEEIINFSALKASNEEKIKHKMKNNDKSIISPKAKKLPKPRIK